MREQGGKRWGERVIVEIIWLKNPSLESFYWSMAGGAQEAVPGSLIQNCSRTKRGRESEKEEERADVSDCRTEWNRYRPWVKIDRERRT